jgi:hypothetical protein
MSARMRSRGDTRVDTGVGTFLCLRGFERNLVSSAGTTTRKAVHRAAEMLHQVNAPLVGAVLNGVTEESGYGNYASRYYASEGISRNGAAGNGSGSDSGRKGRQGDQKAKRRTLIRRLAGCNLRRGTTGTREENPPRNGAGFLAGLSVCWSATRPAR